MLRPDCQQTRKGAFWLPFFYAGFTQKALEKPSEKRILDADGIFIAGPLMVKSFSEF
jgi:hypothetical protein